MKMSDPWRRDTAAKGLAALVGMAGCVDSGLDTLRAGEARRVRDAFFERPQIVHLEIEIQEPDMAALRSYRWQWNAETAPPRPKVAVTVARTREPKMSISLREATTAPETAKTPRRSHSDQTIAAGADRGNNLREHATGSKKALD